MPLSPSIAVAMWSSRRMATVLAQTHPTDPSRPRVAALVTVGKE